LRLSNALIETVKKAGVEVYFADRSTTKVWNQIRSRGEPLQYGGWYWYRKHKGRVVETDEEGPFRSESSAFRDAFIKLQLRQAPSYQER
jgi:hypothetical protein